jgi:DNA-binding XRE family transcriptional regulator
MVQDDKVSAATLTLSSITSSHGMIDARGDAGLGEVVGSASAMEPETPRSSQQRESSGDPVPASTVSASEPGSSDEAPQSVPPPDPKAPKKANNVRKIRIERMMSKAELARRANLSVLTIDRVERGYGCRVDTKRKILEALGLSLADRVRVFGEEE